jgi:hypothetical protein
LGAPAFFDPAAAPQLPAVVSDVPWGGGDPGDAALILQASSKGSGPANRERSLAGARVPESLQVFAPPDPTRVPIGGPSGSATGGGGAAGSQAILLVAMLAVSLSGLVSKRLRPDAAPWRSTMLAPRLERPG